MTEVILPVANSAQLRRAAVGLLRQHRSELTVTLGLSVCAAAVGLVGPALVGRLVDQLLNGATLGSVDKVVGLLLVIVLVQTILTWAARRRSYILGERIFAQLREEFLERVVNLPLSTVEQAGTGDLVTRTTRDVDALSETVRTAIPALLVATIATTLSVIATFLAGWRVALPVLVGLPFLVLGSRWYLRRAPRGYLREGAAYAAFNGAIAETVSAARTVTALGLANERGKLLTERLRQCFQAEKYTLFIRCVWFPAVDIGFYLPVAATLAWGGWLVLGGSFLGGSASIGEVTAVSLYIIAMIDPIDDLLSSLDTIQVGVASFARIVGVGQVPADREPTRDLPAGEQLAAREVHYSYQAGREVLGGISLALIPGERLAVVGPSGAGKSTLARLLAGIHPPGRGAVTVGGVPLVDLPLDTLRGEVALVTQEQHLFVGTIRDNLRLAQPQATDQDLERALDSVAAQAWVKQLPNGLNTPVGSGGFELSEAQAQQLALARLVLKDPHTLILDEATSLLDPRAARQLERSLSAVLAGRTVVAIAHRLHTAHDADRVAVMEAGQLVELGTHEQLLASGKSYARLWQSWSSDPTTESVSQPKA